MDAEEEEEEEMEEEEEEGEEDAIERLKTEIGDRYDEETGKVATVQVSDQLVTSTSNTKSGVQVLRTYELISQRKTDLFKLVLFSLVRICIMAGSLSFHAILRDCCFVFLPNLLG